MSSLTGKHSMTGGGQPAAGNRRGHYNLPTDDGRTVGARLRVSLLDPYPTIEIAGVKHRTGPGLPVALRILGAAPVGPRHHIRVTGRTLDPMIG